MHQIHSSRGGGVRLGAPRLAQPGVSGSLEASREGVRKGWMECGVVWWASRG